MYDEQACLGFKSPSNQVDTFSLMSSEEKLHTLTCNIAHLYNCYYDHGTENLPGCLSVASKVHLSVASKLRHSVASKLYLSVASKPYFCVY